MQKLEIIKADLDNDVHGKAILQITDAYARDPLGMGQSLPQQVKDSLIEKLRDFQCSIHFIAFMDEEPVGVANCVFSFSTFYAAKVVNIHDLAVNPEFRGNGIGEALLGAVQRMAEDEDCCKITLEVREDNRARKLYERFGFTFGEPRMFFMEKPITD